MSINSYVGLTRNIKVVKRSKAIELYYSNICKY